MTRGRLDRFNATMERLVRRWLPDRSAEYEAGPDGGGRRVLVVVNFNASSPELTLDVARSIGKLDHGEVILAYLVELPLASTERPAMVEAATAGADGLAEAARRLWATGVTTRCIVYMTRCVADAMDALTRELDVDLVLHARQRAGVSLQRQG